MDKEYIIHIDMDAFFASVEQRDDPSLLGKPVAIVGSGARTVIVSPSYEARVYGVKTGMRKPEASRLCPELLFVAAHTHKYTDICSQIVELLYQYTPDIEIYSIDEFFLDMTDTIHLYKDIKSLARDMKLKIKKCLRLNCSIGISYNKLLAKLSSDMAKPNGIKVIKKGNALKVLDKIEVDALCGIGKKTKDHLLEMGISTLGELRRYDTALLTRKFGVNGKRLHLMASGIDESGVIPLGEEEEVKSIGHSTTFSKDTSDASLLHQYLLQLSDMVGRRLRRAELTGKTVRLTVRYKSFYTFTRQKSIPAPTDDTKRIYEIAVAILNSIKLKEPIRLLGVTIGNLSQRTCEGELFRNDMRKYKLNKLLDEVNERHGKSLVSYASLLSAKKHKRVISPAWRPDGNRNY